MGANPVKMRQEHMANMIAGRVNQEMERNRRKDEAFDRISKLEQSLQNRRSAAPPMMAPPMYRAPPMRGPSMHRPPMRGPPMMQPYGQPAGGYMPPPPPQPPYMASYGQQPQTQDKSQFWLNTLL